jgi:DNA-binding transcriptional LysR family regulator
MVAGRPIAELCTDLAAAAQRHDLDVLAQLLRITALEAGKHDVAYDGAPFVFASGEPVEPSGSGSLRHDARGVAKRVGISTMLFDPYLMAEDLAEVRGVDIYSDICTNVASSFDAGRIDLAVVLDVKDNRRKLADRIVHEIPIDFAWCCTDGFRRDGDRPIPIVVWPADGFVLDALNASDCKYRVVCTTSDYLSKLAAVKTGTCVAALPRRAIDASLIEIDFDELPSIASKKILIGSRCQSDDSHADRIVSKLKSMADGR